MPIAGDDADALEVAAGLVRDAGFDPVIVGGIERVKDFDAGAAVYNKPMSAAALARKLGVTETSK